ncbi:alpha/beta fold hydrolase [Streptomyces aidingensis]|uniref:Pimeloyl-ACP methyl ester carboxylesterase n=1 Tax=Streptomyces aidingensis TaxID=910347 RepID=A0A1I1HBS6_9ACTN|nr:alpha/beta fold hydrolase [Streptomyces aidingensis]SFC19438.1 Pimeloyl-ACP methyl ester carboxylesterase [Streptomyces aidingensis]
MTTTDTTTTTEPGERLVETWNGEVTLRVRVAGSGPPLVYLHAAGGLVWDPFLARLAEDWTVYAPEFPGTTPGDPYAVHAIDGVWDAVLIYEQALRALGLSDVPLIGQSFGGMLAAELAAAYPAMFSRLVLLDPVGLWLDDAPVSNWVAAAPPELVAMLFHDPSGEAARKLLELPEDPGERAAAQAAMVWNLGATAKLCWPVPDRGLHRRLHRVTAPTLIVWGEQDTLIPPLYAEEFRRRIADSRVAIVPGAGHVPQMEQTAETLRVVRGFLT